MRFLRIVLAKQEGREVMLSDGNIMEVKEVLNSTVIGAVNGVAVSVKHECVVELKADEALNEMLQRNISGKLIETEKPIYLDPKTKKIVSVTKTKAKPQPKAQPKKEPKKEKEKGDIKSTKLSKGDYILLERNDEQIVLTFEGYTRTKDFNCKDKDGHKIQVPKEKFISKVLLVS